MDDGFIKIHRRMLKWEWYKDTNTKVLFLHCLLKANWKDGRFQGIEVPRGSFVTSLSTLSEELSSKEQTFTVQNVRTSLKHLTLTGELTSKSYSKYRIITVNKYNEYQVANIVPNKQLTNSQQATNKQLTTIEEKKEKKEMKRNNGYQKNTKTIEPEPEWLNKKIEKQEVTPEEREEMDELLKEYK